MGNVGTILRKACDLFADNWQGLKYHHSSPKKFKEDCYKAVEGASLLHGLWKIRSMVPDGHADFRIAGDKPSEIYPIVLKYSNGVVTIGASFVQEFSKYVGRRVVGLNNQPVMAVIEKRAATEPQSTREGSLEVAARTITLQPSSKPYEEFPKSLVVEFKDGEKIFLEPREAKTFSKANRTIMSGNGHPSIWGDINLREDDECRGGNEFTKVVKYHQKSWLWWHPQKVSFATSSVEEKFRCWSIDINDVDGVIVDLRDTAGGSELAAAIHSHILGGLDLFGIRHLVSKGIETVKMLEAELGGADKLAGLKITDDGIIFEETYNGTNEGSDIPIWSGPVVVVTNGICGSACDVFAELLRLRNNTCMYGSPPAGRLVGMVSGNSEIDIGQSAYIEVPNYEIMRFDKSKWEGLPTKIDFRGSGGPEEAVQSCFSSLKF